jgi:hypothetical protein
MPDGQVADARIGIAWDEVRCDFGNALVGAGEDFAVDGRAGERRDEGFRDGLDVDGAIEPGTAKRLGKGNLAVTRDDQAVELVETARLRRREIEQRLVEAAPRSRLRQNGGKRVLRPARLLRTD